MDKKPARWVLRKVTRTNAGGTLWNAVDTVTGDEYGVPSHDPDTRQRAVERLNALYFDTPAGHEPSCLCDQCRARRRLWQGEGR